MPTKRILIAGDAHCGHVVGLTPPGWWSSGKLGKIQREMWSWFEKHVQAAGPFDLAVWGGDMIDGRGERSGGTELITTDRIKQVEMAAQVVKSVPTDGHVMVYGTPYHTGNDEDFEDVLASLVAAKSIGGHEWIECNGVVFDIKHKVGSSQVQHGRHTAVARERLWNLLWAERDMAPKADVLVRFHVHYFNHCGGTDWLAMTAPALQGPGSKYGVRACSGIVDFGFLTFEINDDGGYSWKAHTTTLRSGKPKAIRV